MNMEEIEVVNESRELAKTDANPPTTTQPTTAPPPPPDAKALRVTHVGQLLGQAYQGASTLKITNKEAKDLRADFPDDVVEVRSFDGIIYLSHMTLRERLWDVFGPGAVAEICRERFMRNDTNEIAVDLVLMIRGVFVAEGVGTAKYFPNNAKTSFGDTIEAAWSDALRRCCKKFGVGTQVWRPQYVRDWLATYTVQQGGKWIRRKPETMLESADKKVKAERKSREYTLRGEQENEQRENPSNQPRPTAGIEEDDDVPF